MFWSKLYLNILSFYIGYHLNLAAKWCQFAICWEKQTNVGYPEPEEKLFLYMYKTGNCQQESLIKYICYMRLSSQKKHKKHQQKHVHFSRLALVILSVEWWSMDRGKNLGEFWRKSGKTTYLCVVYLIPHLPNKILEKEKYRVFFAESQVYSM